MTARFLVLEGVDGSGKTTQANALVAWLRTLGRDPVHFREPGTTPLGERLRKILLEPGRESWHPRSEALLFFAARRELLHCLVQPALQAGRDVVCERFTPSSLAYQGQADADADFILDLDHLVVGPELQPDRVIVLDLPVSESLQRLGLRNAKTGKAMDGMEERGSDFLRAVRKGYLRYAAAREQQTALMDVSGMTAEQVQSQIRADLQELLA
ncbi:MAG: dTMP kinase [Planctomycetes bacterium]|nr:dTMP kinase [Planctomycetota bacterium]